MSRDCRYAASAVDRVRLAEFLKRGALAGSQPANARRDLQEPACEQPRRCDPGNIVRFATQNIRGLGDRSDGSNPKLEELFEGMRRRRGGACIQVYCLQETWRVGGEDLQGGERVGGGSGFLVLQHGEVERSCSRGRLGVAIVLGVEAQEAYARAGKVKRVYGDRVITARLHALDEKKRTVELYVVNAYAPTGAARQDVKDTYERHLERAIGDCGPNAVLVMAADANACMGRRNAGGGVDKDRVLGPWGEPNCNEAGRRMYEICASHGLCAATTFFQKQRYATWTPPHFQGARRFQLDHFLVRQRDLRRVIDAGVRLQGVYSDHQMVVMDLRVAAKLAKPKTAPTTRTDRGLLRDPEMRRRFGVAVAKGARDAPMHEVGADPHLRLRAGLVLAERLLCVPRRPSPSWYQAAAPVLDELVRVRREAQTALSAACSLSARAARRALGCAQRGVQRAVRRAELVWLEERYEGLAFRGHAAPYRCWQEVAMLRRGWGSVRAPSALPMFRDAAGEIAVTNQENVLRLSEHFGKVFNLPSRVDPDAFARVPQREVDDSLADVPSLEEIMFHTLAASKDKAAGESGVPAEFYQALVDSPGQDGGLECWRECVEAAWTGGCGGVESLPVEYVTGRLKLLYKGKGDNRVLDNWRGIMLLEPAAKIVCAIIARRLAPCVIQEDQCGFRALRGTVDSLWSFKLAAQKRREHQQTSYALYIDLKKAFDSAPREGVYLALKRCGVPERLINLVRAFHTEVRVKVATGDEEQPDIEVRSTVGVKQGDSLAPVLFLILFQACMQALDAEWPAEITKPTFS